MDTRLGTDQKIVFMMIRPFVAVLFYRSFAYLSHSTIVTPKMSILVCNLKQGLFAKVLQVK